MELQLLDGREWWRTWWWIWWIWKLLPNTGAVDYGKNCCGLWLAHDGGWMAGRAVPTHIHALLGHERTKLLRFVGGIENEKG
jgi:hypothetical protein